MSNFSNIRGDRPSSLSHSLYNKQNDTLNVSSSKNTKILMLNPVPILVDYKRKPTQDSFNIVESKTKFPLSTVTSPNNGSIRGII